MVLAQKQKWPKYASSFFLPFSLSVKKHVNRVKRIWYLSPMRAAKVQASLHIRAVSPEPSLLAQTSSESRGTFRQKARSLAPLNGWACAVEICHDGMLEDTNSLDGAHVPSQALNIIHLIMTNKFTHYPHYSQQVGPLFLRHPENASALEFVQKNQI